MDVRVQSLVGGVMWQNDVTKLKSDLPQIIVGKKEIVKKKKKILIAKHNSLKGTPGRVLDMIIRGSLEVSLIKMLVFDEFDDLMSRGYDPQLSEVMRLLPKKCKTSFFTSTITTEVASFIEKWGSEDLLWMNYVRDVPYFGKQYFVDCDRQEFKVDTLVDLLQMIEAHQAVVFCNTSRMVDWLGEQLDGKGLNIMTLQDDVNGLVAEVGKDVKLALRLFLLTKKGRNFGLASCVS
jgi:ATP-dependent RNA helicase